MIESIGLTRRFGDHTAVEKLDLDIKDGEVFGFLGPNGAGKTTTVRMLSCLITPTSGDVLVNGLDVYDREDAKKIRSIVGILTENSGFYYGLSVMKNLRFYADLYKMDRNAAEKNIKYYLKLFNLWELKDSPIGGFSKGMRQKLALTRCLLHDPKLIFMDEPTSGLDPESARVVRESIKRLKGEGRTIILCTHNLDEAERLCDRIAIINRHIIDVGTPKDLQDTTYRRKVIIKLEKIIEPVIYSLSRMDSIRGIESTENRLVLEVDDPESHNADIIEGIVHAGGRIQFVIEKRHTLEDVYLKLVGEKNER